MTIPFSQSGIVVGIPHFFNLGLVILGRIGYMYTARTQELGTAAAIQQLENFLQLPRVQGSRKCSVKKKIALIKSEQRLEVLELSQNRSSTFSQNAVLLCMGGNRVDRLGHDGQSACR